MDKLLIVYAHLIATCMALGIIVTTDLRLIGKLRRPVCVIRPPLRFEAQVMSFALFALCASGAMLVAMDWYAGSKAAGSLNNPKLQAKLFLVALLCLNAIALHSITFPRLLRQVPVSVWTTTDRLCVALPVGLSNSLWMYCAFLGIARSWNHSRTLEEVLWPAAALFALATAGILIFLSIAGRKRLINPQEWVHSVQGQINEHLPVSSFRGVPAFEDTDVVVG